MSHGNGSSNSTNVEEFNGAQQSDTIIYSIIYVTAMISNFLLIAVILKVKRLRSQSNVLILHLAVCDIVRATFGIAFQLGVSNSAYYPYGYIGCKTIQPIATHSTNAIALTLVCIAIERYKAVSSLIKPLTKPIIIGTIISIHIISFLAITPYMIFLQYYAAPYYGCYEIWPNVGSRQAYTMFLFLVQYGLPLPIMVLLYASTWWKIRKQNQSIINMSEDYERKVHHSNDTSVLLTGDKQVESSTNNNIGQSFYAHKPTRVSYQLDSDEDEEKRKSVSFKKRNSIYDSLLKNEKMTSLRNRVQHLKRKKSFMSETALLRHKQTVRTFKMFFIVVAVFAIFSLPNQIMWLVMDFSENQVFPPEIIFKIISYLTFTNAILNCWIYGGFNKSFRIAYREFIISVFSCGMYKADPFYSSPKTRTSTIESDLEQVKRQRKFSEMFQDQINNFEKYRHLYKFENEDKVDIKRQVESTTNIKQKIEKRKKSIANFLVSLQPSSRKNSCQTSPTRMRKTNSIFSSLAQNKLSSSKGKLNMIPPIIPFTEAAGNVNGGEQASKTKSRRASPQSSNTRHRRYSEDNSNRRKRKSSWRYSLFTPKSTTFSWNTKNTNSSTPSSSIHIEEVSTVQVTMQQVRTVTITKDGKQTCYHETVNRNHHDNKNTTENDNKNTTENSSLPKSPFSITVSKCRNNTIPLHNSVSSVKETVTNQATVKQNSENQRAINDDLIKRNPSLKKLKTSQLVSKNLSKFEYASNKQPINEYNRIHSRTQSVPDEPVVHQKVRRRATLDPPDLEQLDTRPDLEKLDTRLQQLKGRPMLSRAEIVISKTRELKSFKNTNSSLLNQEYSHIFNNSSTINFNRKTSLTPHVMNQCNEERHTIL